MTGEANAQSKQYLHYNPEWTDYSITPEELTHLQEAGSNLWKDICLVSAPVGLSCLINAIGATISPFKLDLPLFLNYLFGVVGLVLALIFGIAWSKSARRFTSLINQIKNKPKMEILPSTTNVGAITMAVANGPMPGDGGQLYIRVKEEERRVNGPSLDILL